VSSFPDAEKILASLKNGADFASAARAYSIDPSASDGGDLGTLDLGSLRPEVQDALRRIKPGELTGIVKVANGYAILKMLSAKQRDENAVRSDAGKAAETKEGNATPLGSRPPLRAPPATRITPPVSGYEEFYEAIRNRTPADPQWGMDLKAVCAVRKSAPAEAIDALKATISGINPDADPRKFAFSKFTLEQLYSARGDVDDQINEAEEVYRFAVERGNPAVAALLEEVLGVGYLHRASFADHGSQTGVNGSRLFPMHPGAAHMRPGDVDKSIDYLTKAMKREPDNQELQWLLNLAYMTADLYPSHVPEQFLIPPAVFASKEDLGRFPDVAPAAGLNVYGNAGGVIVDDFDGDGLLDVMTSSVDDCEPLHFFHNNGDGTFSNRTAAAGLSDQLGGLNIIQADYNNDGCVDVLVLRGGWELPRRRSLLRNNCDGTFTDVTAAAGLLEPMRSSQSAVWVDIDNDGKLDLFIANENAPSQLFLNKGDGTFVDISHAAGVDRAAFSKSVVASDYDGDGYSDLYVSNFNGHCFRAEGECRLGQVCQLFRPQDVYLGERYPGPEPARRRADYQGD